MSPATPAAADAPLGDAVAWVAGTLTGSVATSVAVLAVAATGVLMLRGRVPVRRGATVVIGCFVLFSAATIASGILTGVGQTEAPAPVAVPAPAYTPVTPRPPSSDPYAGVAVPKGR